MKYINFKNPALELDSKKRLKATLEGETIYERFVDIIGYESLYQISTFGRVKSIERKEWMPRNKCYKKRGERILTQHLSPYGYYSITLSKDNVRETNFIHVLVGKMFLGHVPDGGKTHVDHIDGVKTHNFRANLQILTSREHAVKTRINNKTTSKYTGVCWDKRRKKWHSSIYVEGKKKTLGYFDTEEEASKYYQDALKCIRDGRIEDIKVKRRKTSSSVKGVVFLKRAKKWIPRVKENGKRKSLGSFKTEQEAIDRLNQYKKTQTLPPLKTNAIIND